MTERFKAVTFEGNMGTVRMLNLGGKPWLIMKDVCTILKVTNISDIKRQLDGDMWNKAAIQGTAGPKMLIINEMGLYEVLCQVSSSRSSVNSLAHWLENEVLPGFDSQNWDDDEDPAYVTGPSMVDEAPKAEEMEPGLDKEYVEAAAEPEPEAESGMESIDPASNNVVPFSHEKFGKLDVIMKEGKPFFVATDVARKLGYARPRDAVSQHCKNVLITPVCKTPTGGTTYFQDVRIIPESDLYRLVMRSNLPQAIKFQDWVVEEVLPQIRETGGYMTEDALMNTLSDPGFWLKMVGNLAARAMSQYNLGGILQGVVGAAGNSGQGSGDPDTVHHLNSRLYHLEEELKKEKERADQMAFYAHDRQRRSVRPENHRL